jgi:antitoxin ParD1/3/4
MPPRASLNVSLTLEFTAYIADQVASGRYRSASEVVRAGLRLLQRDELAGATPPPPAVSDGTDEGDRRREQHHPR